jgi:hypothetical protein
MEKREWVRPWLAFGLVLGSSASGCNAKPELAAYFHKTEVAPEPAASISLAAAPSARAAATSESGASDGRPLDGTYAKAAPSRPAGALQAADAKPAGAHIVSAVPAAPASQPSLPAAVPTPSAAVPTPSAAVVTLPAKSGRGNASIGGAAVSGGSVRNAARVIASLRGGLRECYQRGESDAEGAILFRLTVGANGAVTAVSAQPSGGVNGDLVQCTTARVRGAKFDAPEGGSATIAFPVTFVIERTP